jgi:RimJ/RimL family protein N-acetyltransferase
MYHLPGSPAGQAERDLEATAETPGRTMMGIALRVDESDPAGFEMVGVVDFRMHWPDEDVVYLGMIMVAEAYQRQGIGRAAWRLLAPWLAQSAQMKTARAGVEQFNPGALKFLQSVGFQLTGDTSRVQSGKRWVRLLYMDYDLAQEPG